MNAIQPIIKQKHSANAILYALSRLFERAGYYGFRSILVLYLMSSTIGMTAMEAMRLYGTFASLFYFAKMVGGTLGDLVFGNKLAILLGGGLQLVGVLVLCLPHVFGMYSGVGLLIIGSGLYDPNLLALFGKQYLNKPKVIDSGFGLFYIGVNIGAFIGMLFVAVLSEVEMYYGFLLACGFYILAISIIFAITPDKPLTEEEVAIDKKEYKVEPKDVFLVILVFLMSSLFWTCFELTTPLQMTIGFDLEEIAFELTGQRVIGLLTRINSVVILAIGGILTLLWFYVYSSSIIKIAIGFCLAALSFVMLLLVTGFDELNGFYLFVSSIVFLGIAEFFVIPPILSILVLKSNPKYLAMVMGGFGFVGSLFVIVTSTLSSLLEYSDSSGELPLYVSIVLCIILSSVLVIVYFVNKASDARIKYAKKNTIREL
jgi:POT family proton-dependent oligopeptide transporter